MCVSISKYNFKIFKLDFFTGKIGNCRPKQKKKKYWVEILSSFLSKPLKCILRNNNNKAVLET